MTSATRRPGDPSGAGFEGGNDAGKTVFTYAHPLFWAPYSIIGDGSAQ
jgi:hypothetical protein